MKLKHNWVATREFSKAFEIYALKLDGALIERIRARCVGQDGRQQPLTVRRKPVAIKVMAQRPLRSRAKGDYKNKNHFTDYYATCEKEGKLESAFTPEYIIDCIQSGNNNSPPLLPPPPFCLFITLFPLFKKANLLTKPMQSAETTPMDLPCFPSPSGGSSCQIETRSRLLSFASPKTV